MEPSTLIGRIEKYLARQSQWVEDETRLVAEMETLLARADPALDAMLETVLRAGRQLESLAEEHRLLLRDWNSAKGISAAERRSLEQRYAGHAEAAAALARRQAALLDVIAARQQQNKEQLAEMTRGKAMLRGYGTGMDHESGYVDKKS